MYCLDLGRVEWRRLEVGGTVPDGRINHTLCAYNRTLYLFGGAFKGNAFGEVGLAWMAGTPNEAWLGWLEAPMSARMSLARCANERVMGLHTRSRGEASLCN